MHAAHRGDRHFQRLGELGAQREDALRMRPHRHLAVLEFGDRARRPDRSVRHVGLGVDRLEGARVCGRGTLFDADRRIFARQRLDHVEQTRGIGELRPQCPFRALEQSGARLDRLLFAFGHDTEERAVAHDGNDARHCFRRGFVDAVELRAVARRTYHAAMQHAGKPHVLDECRAAGDFARNIETRNGFPDDLVSGGRFRRRLGTRFAVEIGIEIAVTDLASVRRRDRAVGNRQLVRRHAEPLGGEIDQDRAHFGGGHAQRRAAVLDRLATGGLSLVRRLTGIAGDHLDAGQRQIELFGCDLRERGEDALPQLDLAGEDGRGAVGIDADPTVEPAIVLQTAG